MSEILLGLLVLLFISLFVAVLRWLRPLKQGFEQYMVVNDGD